MAAQRGRDNRPGSVRQKKGRTTWEARIALPGIGSLSRSFPSEREGWRWIDQTLVDARRGTFVRESGRRTRDVLDEWLEMCMGRDLRATSIDNYRRSITYLLPYIGNIKVSDLKRPDIEKALAKLVKADGSRPALSASTRNQTFRVLKMALDYCEDVEYIAKNPMGKLMKAPPAAEPRDRVFSQQEVESLLQAVTGTRWEAAFWLLATTGMRIGEVLGLEWKNVDLDSGRIHIERQTNRIPREPGVRLLPLKTKASRREVIVPPIVCTILRWHRDQQSLERRRALEAGDWEEHGTVFATPQGKLYFRSQLEDVYRGHAKELGIDDAGPHTFRHTVVTMVQAEGHPIKDAQTLVGHATDRMTSRVYSHPTAGGKQRIADDMQRLLGPLRSDVPDPTLTPEEAPWNTHMGRSMGQAVAVTA